MPAQIAAQSARFGLIGVAFVLVPWLVPLGLLLVFGGELVDRRAARLPHNMLVTRQG